MHAQERLTHRLRLPRLRVCGGEEAAVGEVIEARGAHRQPGWGGAVGPSAS
jgi:hypothetical protein